ncbi:MAG: gliding motility protein GldN [Paludibacteraceae bacterium]|nr:gliding motility protein GldN [Paludibacteraceae bacterium]
MKKIGILFLLLGICVGIRAQLLEAQEVLSYFEKNGTVRMETAELDASADTLVIVQHRKDDVVWSRIVYRIIDMRYKQNYQLYYPFNISDPQYKSLWRIVLEASAEGLPLYQNVSELDFKPQFGEEELLTGQKKSDRFMVYDETGNVDRTDEETFLLYYDSINNKFQINPGRYSVFVRDQLKYLVQEVIFFDKHTSRMHRQIIAIAPLHPSYAHGSDPMEFLRSSVLFWILYQDLRPYLAKNYIIPFQNETKRVTFDEFFQKRLFTSYLVGEGNMYNRMILEYAKTMTEAQKEQARIESELLNFELDLWEY